MYRDLIPLLADRYHLIAPDYPGFGYSATPTVDDFRYTFDHLADVMTLFIDELGLDTYALYMQDFGGPVGFRIAVRRPGQVSALLIQNANAYDEGMSVTMRTYVLPLWPVVTPATEAKARPLFELPNTKRQIVEGAPDPELVSPDTWQHAQWGLDRPGMKDMALALHADYGSNLERYAEWQAYFRRYQPHTLVTWGRADFIFTVEGATAYRRDIPNAEIHILDAGHFALETSANEIAMSIGRFLPQRVREGRRSA
jgi:pimeloyl-ACP methyl ester carboxylesterase